MGVAGSNFLARVREKVRIRTLTEVVEVTNKGVVVRDPENNVEEIPAETVIVAAGLSCRTDLMSLMEQSGAEYHAVGSCHTPGQVAEAIAEGINAVTEFTLVRLQVEGCRQGW